MVFFPYADDVKDVVKSNGERLLAVSENSVGMKKVIDSNVPDGAIHGKSTRLCSRETLNGRLSFNKNALGLLDSYMVIIFFLFV